LEVWRFEERKSLQEIEKREKLKDTGSSLEE